MNVVKVLEVTHEKGGNFLLWSVLCGSSDEILQQCQQLDEIMSGSFDEIFQQCQQLDVIMFTLNL